MTAQDTLRVAPPTRGMVIHWARLYDVVVQLISLGRERAMRQQTVVIADVKPGQRVLDVGCGTGTLAIAVARAAPGAEVQGLDPAPSMIARARHKAEAAGVQVRFEVGVVEHLDLEDDSVDVVLSTLMLHHLPGTLLQEGLREIFRVLKPGGRLVAVDFFGRPPLSHRLASQLGGRRSHRHAHDTGMVATIRDVGFIDPSRERMSPGYLSSLVTSKPL